MTTHEKKLQTVRKLLAKAERAGTPEEAEAFRGKATELMVRYSIDEALLGAKHETDDRVGTRRFVVRGYAKPKSAMLAGIAEVLGAKAIRLSDQSTYGTAVIVVYGWESDLALLEVLFASLEIQATREAKAAHRQQPWVNGMTFTTSFLVGFASAVVTRLQQQHRKVVAEHTATDTPGTALVLVDRKAAVETRLGDDHPKLRKNRHRVATNSAAAYYGGREAGERADLGRGGLGGSRRAVAGGR